MGKFNLSKILLTVAISLLSSIYSYAQESEDAIFQTSTIDALIQGVYDGDFTFGDLREQGDFGLGTFNRLDGEMIGLDGTFYQVRSDGTVHVVPDSMKTPFAAVTFFESDKSVSINKPFNCEQLKEYLVSIFPTQNTLYAIKVNGNFPYIKTRSVPKQEQPYPPLTEVVKDEAIFEFYNVSGTIVGFWLPEYLKNINVTGFHFHFISEDKKLGGHVLECKVNKAEVEIDYIRDIYISLPDTKAFNDADINKTVSGDVNHVEGNKKSSPKEK